jgi:hypothetical protein
MYEPVWFTEKSLSAVAEGLAASASGTLVALALGHDRQKPVRTSPTSGIRKLRSRLSAGID